eukprot:TRINITY_DN9182_c0_g2_i2.p1 TRINITY_DN9182_c0_g2~~TRINITY_DN9182_c0_g2_i2.p1  ORF type:complete len:703 (+),score=175.24 TRINITY_DN9182_c0_g2_i2:135-2243(+)
MSAPEMIVLNFLSHQKIYRQELAEKPKGADGNAVVSMDGSTDRRQSNVSRGSTLARVGTANSDRPPDRGANGVLLQDKVKEEIAKLRINDVVWQEGVHATYNDDSALSVTSDDPNQSKIQVILPSVGGERTERILSSFQNLGFGEPGSHTSLWILPMVLRLPEPSAEEKGDDVIRARVTVAQIINNLKSAAAVTLDYIGLCFAASVIAAIGLGRDDTVATVASMLISPLMGPILAYTFGTVVHDKELKNQGLYAELIGLAICVVTGFLIGLAAGDWGEQWNFPSEFMRSRGTGEGILVGLGIAVPSGIGVALSVLGNNTGSLVGVAISASLLPPAVNFGMLWGFGAIAAAKGQDSDEVAKYFELGIVSFALTIMNIVVIFIMGIFSLNIKSAIPRGAGATELWKHDVPAYRHYKDHNTKGLQKQWAEYMANQQQGAENGETVVEDDTDSESNEGRVERITALDQQRRQNARGMAGDYDAELAFKPLMGISPHHPDNVRRRRKGPNPTLRPHKSSYTTQAPGKAQRNRITRQHFEPTIEVSEESPLAGQESPTPTSNTATNLTPVVRPTDPDRPSGAPLIRPSVMLEERRPNWHKEGIKGTDPVRQNKPNVTRKVSQSLFKQPSVKSKAEENESQEGQEGSMVGQAGRHESIEGHGPSTDSTAADDVVAQDPQERQEVQAAQTTPATQGSTAQLGGSMRSDTV